MKEERLVITEIHEEDAYAECPFPDVKVGAVITHHDLELQGAGSPWAIEGYLYGNATVLGAEDNPHYFLAIKTDPMPAVE